MKNRRDRQMSKKRQLASVLASRGPAALEGAAIALSEKLTPPAYWTLDQRSQSQIQPQSKT
ncbi:exported hypothetical protein [Verrucomicrobia bacterium]|nr:exported hypothetical protein [Verrucomicrobiota bacterium]